MLKKCAQFIDPKTRQIVRLGKIIISTSIILYISQFLNEGRIQNKYYLNTTNRIHKYFYLYPVIQGNLLYHLPTFILITLMILSSLMVFTKSTSVKLLLILTIVIYLLLIPNFYIIVPDYYQIRDWIGILAGIVYLIAADREQVQGNKKQDMQKQNKQSKQMGRNISKAGKKKQKAH